jgi:hypothetical protein
MSLWNMTAGKKLYSLKKGNDVRMPAFSPDGRMLATADYTGPGRTCSVRLWDVPTNKELREFKGFSLGINCEWITKMDVGGPSEQNGTGDRVKAAVSDALKRAAVKYGIGRYLYDLPRQWVEYDPQKKQFVRTPALPAWAVPKGKASDRITPEQGKALEALLRAGKVRWEDFAERYQIGRLGQLAKGSYEEAKGWLTGKLEAQAKK